MICKVCKRDIQEDEACYQIRYGTSDVDSDFVPEEDVAYLHSRCVDSMSEAKVDEIFA